MGYKLWKFRVNRARDTHLRGVYIPNYGKISVKIQLWGSYTLIVAPIGMKFGILHAKFHRWGEIRHGGVDLRSTPPCLHVHSFMLNFTHRCMQRIAPVGRKTSKSISE